MCIPPSGKEAIYTEKGRRNADGSLTPDSKLNPGENWQDRRGASRQLNATDVPLGSGELDAARLSLLTRRERIRQAVEGE